jgi:hypothetical protein
MCTPSVNPGWRSTRRVGTKSAAYAELVSAEETPATPYFKKTGATRLCLARDSKRRRLWHRKKRYFRIRVGGADQSNAQYGSSDLKDGRRESEDQKEDRQKEDEKIAALRIGGLVG